MDYYEYKHDDKEFDLQFFKYQVKFLIAVLLKNYYISFQVCIYQSSDQRYSLKVQRNISIFYKYYSYLHRFANALTQQQSLYSSYKRHDPILGRQRCSCPT